MDHLGYKLTQPTTEPPIPAILMTSITTAEGELSLAICRTVARHEGTCIVELWGNDDVCQYTQTGDWRLDDSCDLWIAMHDNTFAHDHEDELMRLGLKVTALAHGWGVRSWAGSE